MFHYPKMFMVVLSLVVLSVASVLPAQAQSRIQVVQSSSYGLYINIQIWADGSNLCARMTKSGGTRFTDDGNIYLRFRQVNTSNGRQYNYDYNYNLSRSGILKGSYGITRCVNVSGKFASTYPVYVRYGLFSNNDPYKEKSSGNAAFRVY